MASKCKCRVCGRNDVEYAGAICDLCALGKDPYSGGSGYGNSGYGNSGYGNSGYGNSGYGNSGYGNSGYGNSGYGNSGYGNSGYGNSGYGNSGYGGSSSNLPEERGYGGLTNPGNGGGGVNVYKPGEFVTTSGGNNVGGNALSERRSSREPITEGVVRNIGIGNEKRPGFVRMLQSIFTGVPYVTDNFVTSFQVYPDQMGGGFTTGGYACDQVVLYGKLNPGMINDNNEVEVYGVRDSHNTIIAKKVINRSSGITITPQHTVPAWLVRAVALILLAVSIAIVCAYGAEGLLTAVILIICLLNLPLVLKIVGWMIKTLFKLIGMFI